MFLASDRSGYAARRAVGGRAHRTSGRERHRASGGVRFVALPPGMWGGTVPPAALFLFLEKINRGKRKRACGRGVKKRASRCLLGARADARKCRGGLRGRRWCDRMGEMSRIAVGRSDGRQAQPLRPVCALGTSPYTGEARGRRGGAANKKRPGWGLMQLHSDRCKSYEIQAFSPDPAGRRSGR